VIPDPSNPQVGDVFVGDVFIDRDGDEVTVRYVATSGLAYSWVDDRGNTIIDVADRDHVAKHWKPKRPEPPIVTGVEFADGRRTTAPDWDAARARAYFPEFVRIGPARVVFVEDEQ